MKLLMVLIPLISLEFAMLVSSQSVTDVYQRLLVLRSEKRSYADNKIAQLYTETANEIRRQLNDSLIPSLNRVDRDISNYVKDMINRTSASGYNVTVCVDYLNILAESVIQNITQKARNELIVVYESILSMVLYSGSSNMQTISEEVESIDIDYYLCITSLTPQFCNTTLVNKIMEAQEQLPSLFEKEVERTAVAFVQQIVNYESRIQDYVQEAAAAMKPYLSLLETCVSFIALGV